MGSVGPASEPEGCEEAAQSGGMFVEGFEITHVLPCLADPSKIRFHAAPSVDLGPVLPYLNAILSRAVYHHAACSLTLQEEHRTICLQPNLVTGAKVDDLEDARRLLAWLQGVINDTWARRQEITPSYERRQRLAPAALFALLPRTNCRACGLPTCLAFAVEVTAERQSILRCSPLFTAAHQPRRQLALSLLAKAGYEVPDGFRDPEGLLAG